MARHRVIGGLILALLMTTATVASAAYEGYLKIDGVTGESKAQRHSGEIDVVSFSFGMKQEGATMRGGAGRASVHPLTLEKRLDSSSVELYLMCVQGKHVPQARLFLTKTGGAGDDFLIMTLTDVVIGSCLASGKTGDALPTEQVTLNFAKIAWEYRPQMPDGRLGAPIKGGWDIQNNERVEAPSTGTEVATEGKPKPQLGPGILDVLREKVLTPRQ